METTNFKVLPSDSRVDWIGRKFTGAHNGTISIQDGTFVLNDGKIKDGYVIINISTIKILDIKDPATNAEFAGHLASNDFFSIEKFPSATFNILNIKEFVDNTFYLKGILTIKDISKIVGFEVKMEQNINTIRLWGKLNIDRTKYDIKFRSGTFFENLGDKLIYNDFELNFNITAEANFTGRTSKLKLLELIKSTVEK
jgi:polyisoprenoid-binding protein YceI